MKVEKCEICEANATNRLPVETGTTIEKPLYVCARHAAAYRRLVEMCNLRSRLDAAEARVQ